MQANQHEKLITLADVEDAIAALVVPGERWHVSSAGNCARNHAICEGPAVIARVTGLGYPFGTGWSGRSEARAHLMAAAPELAAVLIQAVESSGFSLSGPTDSRAAEHGEPAWVCNARAVIAKAAGGAS